MKERLDECAQVCETLLAELLELGQALGTTAGHGGEHHERIEHVVELATRLRSDLRRLAKYAEA